MEKIKYFILEESAYHPNKYIIRPDLDKFPDISTEGSFAVLAARVMNLSYAQYCRMCRDIFRAEIIGKRDKYPRVLFTDSHSPRALLKVLNAQMNLIMYAKEHPLTEEQEKILEEKMKEGIDDKE